MVEPLKIPYPAFNNNWDLLQEFLKRNGNPMYEMIGDLILMNQKETYELGNLIRVNGNLKIIHTPIVSLGKVEYILNDLLIYNSPTKSLGNLMYVGGDMDIRFADIESFGCIEHIGGHIVLLDNHKISKDEFLKIKENNICCGECSRIDIQQLINLT